MHGNKLQIWGFFYGIEIIMNNHTIILLLAATFCTAIAALLCA
ncbi:hypothetical protein HMPREF0476_0389 [Kingella kingae ATCC 23330]|uniref:Uncharacterized protein n=1 Tax=Kingella kingae ATCC 23330 TaxID=887327 RepID=F5S5A6_KINKI|nr:hypothetical protein HMPREF0476_0389 [Kingella kingae ATCC 23330]